ncbi:hypothetical protein E5329_19895 [Petralouisia muris]|uniref:Uncharacterized protein n=1 Tax=Petralouisia muris TaxID=3032872 RepID=A0AC61RSC0_9FIRM|nr:AAA family ATPase [Petralouisia muris]TGY91929.1 hypothetical protein E5329_19895 [Petralouisia muris]
MPRKTGLGHQDFETVRLTNNFYVDKTDFIREWWEANDLVTLITRPRRFGKTLNMSMLEKFFSVKYAGRGELFEGLSIWWQEEYRNLQGTYPVMFLSFAAVKETTFDQVRKNICRMIGEFYNRCGFLLEGDLLNENEKRSFQNISADMEDNAAASSLRMLSEFLTRYYGKRVIILLDEYDTPMQEAYVNGYWEEMVSFIRALFNATFKTNPSLERAILTGITRISKESIFSDLNHLEVVTTTVEKYECFFGFTEEEVFAALEEFGLSAQKEEVKKWYDGFTFGNMTDIYNPWSVLNYLSKRRVELYWANTSSNSLAGDLIREGNKNLKLEFETLMRGGSILTVVDEQIVYSQLSMRKDAIWSFLLAAGYLKVEQTEFMEQSGNYQYRLSLTNREVRMMFQNMILDWFEGTDDYYNDFIKALLLGDVKAMNHYMNKVTLTTFSYFDTGKKASEAEPERFYHGFVLGLMVELSDRYILTSNRESGFGRYDVVLEPRKKEDDAMILEFKVQDTEDEKELKDTVKAALAQIKEKNYAASLLEKGVPRERIRSYGFAFQGKTVRIGTDGKE